MTTTEFQRTVADILRAANRAGPPTKGFGAQHFENGRNPEYRGPAYGQTTVMDAYFHAGKKFADRRFAEETEDVGSSLPSKRDLLHAALMGALSIVADDKSRSLAINEIADGGVRTEFTGNTFNGYYVSYFEFGGERFAFHPASRFYDWHVTKE